MIEGLWERTHAPGVEPVVDVKCLVKVRFLPPTLSSQTWLCACVGRWDANEASCPANPAGTSAMNGVKLVSDTCEGATNYKLIYSSRSDGLHPSCMSEGSQPRLNRGEWRNMSLIHRPHSDHSIWYGRIGKLRSILRSIKEDHRRSLCMRASSLNDDNVYLD